MYGGNLRNQGGAGGGGGCLLAGIELLLDPFLLEIHAPGQLFSGLLHAAGPTGCLVRSGSLGCFYLQLHL
jgi:hypothetical protein